MNVVLPIDKAWEVVKQNIDFALPGAVQVNLNRYKIGVHGDYSLVAVNYEDAASKIFAAVEVEGADPVALRHPAEELNLQSGRFIGIPVKNAMQAGVVIHIIEDSAKEGIHPVQAVNYIAERWQQ